MQIYCSRQGRVASRQKIPLNTRTISCPGNTCILFTYTRTPFLFQTVESQLSLLCASCTVCICSNCVSVIELVYSSFLGPMFQLSSPPVMFSRFVLNVERSFETPVPLLYLVTFLNTLPLYLYFSFVSLKSKSKMQQLMDSSSCISCFSKV